MPCGGTLLASSPQLVLGCGGGGDGGGTGGVGGTTGGGGDGVGTTKALTWSCSVATPAVTKHMTYVPAVENTVVNLRQASIVPPGALLRSLQLEPSGTQCTESPWKAGWLPPTIMLVVLPMKATASYAGLLAGASSPSTNTRMCGGGGGGATGGGGPSGGGCMMAASAVTWSCSVVTPCCTRQRW